MTTALRQQHKQHDALLRKLKSRARTERAFLRSIFEEAQVRRLPARRVLALAEFLSTIKPVLITDSKGRRRPAEPPFQLGRNHRRRLARALLEEGSPPRRVERLLDMDAGTVRAMASELTPSNGAKHGLNKRGKSGETKTPLGAPTKTSWGGSWGMDRSRLLGLTPNEINARDGRGPILSTRQRRRLRPDPRPARGRRRDPRGSLFRAEAMPGLSAQLHRAVPPPVRRVQAEASLMGRTQTAAPRREAERLRHILDHLDAGKIYVSGPGHSVARTRARLQDRIADLEGGGGDRRG